jgi:hypothetical protein
MEEVGQGQTQISPVAALWCCTAMSPNRRLSLEVQPVGRMRAELKAALQGRWEDSLRQRAALSPVSAVPLLDRLLAGIRPASKPVRSRLAPKIGHRERRNANGRLPDEVRAAVLWSERLNVNRRTLRLKPSCHVDYEPRPPAFQAGRSPKSLCYVRAYGAAAVGRCQLLAAGAAVTIAISRGSSSGRLH